MVFHCQSDHLHLWKEQHYFYCCLNQNGAVAEYFRAFIIVRYLLQPKYTPQCILCMFTVIQQMAITKDGESMNSLGMFGHSILFFLMTHLYIVLPHSHVPFGIILRAPNLGALYELFSLLSQSHGFRGYGLTCEFRMCSTDRDDELNTNSGSSPCKEFIGP